MKKIETNQTFRGLLLWVKFALICLTQWITWSKWQWCLKKKNEILEVLHYYLDEEQVTRESIKNVTIN